MSPRSPGALIQSTPMIDESNFSADGLRSWSFQGYQTIGRLRSTALADVPLSSGVYAVMRPDLLPPTFLSLSSGGRWKGKDPNVSMPTLKAAWVDDAYVLYFGKAKNLRDRLGLYLDFGAGSNVMHFGGRYLWHLDHTETLQVAWVVTGPIDAVNDPARNLERILIAGFQQVYGKRPFANIQG